VHTKPRTSSVVTAIAEGAAAGRSTAAAGVSSAAAMARLAPIVARGSASASLRLRIIGPIA
jgi:hypothetical protein